MLFSRNSELSKIGCMILRNCKIALKSTADHRQNRQNYFFYPGQPPDLSEPLRELYGLCSQLSAESFSFWAERAGKAGAKKAEQLFKAGSAC